MLSSEVLHDAHPKAVPQYVHRGAEAVPAGKRQSAVLAIVYVAQRRGSCVLHVPGLRWSRNV